ncbi:MAG: BrnT family toxin [Pseudomonadota bacterium]
MVLRGAGPWILEWLREVWSGEFDWDEQNLSKLRKHGFTKEEVESCFSNDIVLAGESIGDFGESRLVSYGHLPDGRNMTVAWTPRQDTIRPISCRRSRDGEKKVYEDARK